MPTWEGAQLLPRIIFAYQTSFCFPHKFQDYLCVILSLRYIFYSIFLQSFPYFCQHNFLVPVFLLTLKFLNISFCLSSSLSLWGFKKAIILTYKTKLILEGLGISSANKANSKPFNLSPGWFIGQGQQAALVCGQLLLLFPSRSFLVFQIPARMVWQTLIIAPMALRVQTPIVSHTPLNVTCLLYT